jgi:hypothetical protein
VEHVLVDIDVLLCTMAVVANPVLVKTGYVYTIRCHLAQKSFTLEINSSYPFRQILIYKNLIVIIKYRVVFILHLC